MNIYTFECTDTFNGEANYTWCKRGTVTTADINEYGFDGTHGYARASARMELRAVRETKAALGLTGVRCDREMWGQTIVLRPRGLCAIVFIDWTENR